MPHLDTAIYELGYLDRLGTGASFVHRVDPRVKVLVTFVFLVCVVSFDRYEILGLVPFILFPVALASAADLPFAFLGKRLMQVAPFALTVGAFNPWFDREVVGVIGGLAITGGWVSYASIILRFLLCTSAALVLISTTSMADICRALQRLGVPEVFATQLMFLYRYMFLLAEEVLRMARARELRSFEGRGLGLRVYSTILGHLLLRTVARAQRIYEAMRCRGFDGVMRTRRTLKLHGTDVAFLLGWTATFVIFRAFDVAHALGALVTGVI